VGLRTPTCVALAKSTELTPDPHRDVVRHHHSAPPPTRPAPCKTAPVAFTTDDDRVAVITGGASGIGLATARLLAERGWRLVLADIEADRLHEAAGQLGGGDAVVEVVTDVASKESVDALADRTYERFGRADVVFSNAGVAMAGPTIDMTHADWTWVLDVDLWGPIHGVEAFLPRIAEQGRGGHLLFTASFAGLAPNLGLGPYCVAKYGVVALAEVLHRELRPSGIGVSVLCPMRVETDIGRSGRNRPVELGGPAPAAARTGAGPAGAGSSPTGAAPTDPGPGPAGPDDRMAGRILPVGVVAEQVVEAIGTDRLYIVPHEESREMIRRRFQRIDRAFEDLPSSAV
jgi:NAD(P)-dependent dehydrogenase (short-subunit alcohol dehydrogenase family)